MTELLHVWALAPAAIGTCCLAADRRRVRAPELSVSVLMLVAMADAAYSSVIAPIYWAILLLAAAMALAALRGARRRGERAPHGDRAMTLHSAFGLIVMAALLVAMTGGGPTMMSASEHSHGASGSLLSFAIIVAVALYAAASGVAAVRSARWLDRAQYAGMGASAVAMAFASLL